MPSDEAQAEGGTVDEDTRRRIARDEVTHRRTDEAHPGCDVVVKTGVGAEGATALSRGSS